MMLPLLRFSACVALFLGLAISAIPGCDGRAPGTREAPTDAAAELPPPDQVYTTRGRIHDLPDPARPASGLMVTHEAIDDFVDRHGTIVGMDAMTMPLTPARELSLEEFSIGDIVEVVFEVRWNPTSTRVIEMRKLPEDTELEFRTAQPPQ